MSDLDFDKTLEEMGVDRVRVQMAGPGFSGAVYPAALAWLAKKNQEERERIEASSSEQIRLIRDANTIATQARNAARAALTVAIISTIVGITALVMR